MSPDAQPYTHIPIGTAVLCNNDHVYDAGRFGLCPACQSYDRLSLETMLSPEVLSPRIRRVMNERQKAGGASPSMTAPLEPAGGPKLKGL